MNLTISQEQQIFLRAIEYTDSKTQKEFLADACANDRAMLEKILRLVSLHRRTDNLLDFADDMAAKSDSRSGFAADAIAEGMRIGPYKLFQELGDGGMGVVFMAEQSQPVRRKVAIKVIKLGMASRNVVARFDSECQTLAMMDHPNITKLLDTGITEGGRPYFVMELIVGLPITKYVEKRKLNLRDRVDLFIQVCHAIQHAHQKGVIHRDIKPNNILVTEFDGKPIVKVIDFGISKALEGNLTDKTMFTSYGNMLGTPEYMSPEQAEMNGREVDTCSDVYSLGVVLYELMTGSNPFAKHREQGLIKLFEAIRQVEPALASTCINHVANTKADDVSSSNFEFRGRNQYLKGDLDWILAKSLAKRPEDRYLTVAELAADLQRHLVGEPVVAGVPSKSYRLKKFFVRHRLAILTGSVLSAAMIVATVVSLCFALRANHAERLAEQHLQESLLARREAEMERDRALAAEDAIRDLERTSRFDAANAKAILRYMNQQPVSKSVTSDQETEAATKSKIMKVRVAPNGDLSMSTDDGKFKLKFADRTSGTRLKTSTRLRIKELGPDSREQVRQVLGFVTSELRNKFGKWDLYVAEPQMMLAELEMEDKNWRRAENLVRHTGFLFVNNFADDDLIIKNRLLLAFLLLKQDQQSLNGLELLTRNQGQIATLAGTDERLNQTVLKIRELVNDGCASGRAEQKKDSALQIAVNDFLLLQDVIVAEVLASMETAFEERTQSINRRRGKR